MFGRLVLLSAVVLLLVVPAASAAPWLRPVDGPLLHAFAVGRDPYAAGWHRGVDLAAARGARVRSACGGRVSFAGRVPRGGDTVSVRCGALVATYQQLGSIAVGAGGDVARGALVGTVGASSDPRQRRPHVHLGARELATGRYVDPLGLLGRAAPALPLVPGAPRGVPLGPAPRAAPGTPRPVAPRVAPARVRPHVAPRPAPVRVRPRAPASSHAPSPGSQPIPWLVWVGLASFGLGLPFGGFVRLRRRRRSSSRVAQTA